MLANMVLMQDTKWSSNAQKGTLWNIKIQVYVDLMLQHDRKK